MERNVRLGCVLAWLAWALAVLLTAGGSIAAVDSRTGLSLALLSHAVLFMGAAATLTVRGLLERQDARIRDAFKMGQETAALRKVR